MKLVFQVTSNNTFLFLVNIPVAQGDQLDQVVHEVPKEKNAQKITAELSFDKKVSGNVMPSFAKDEH